MKKIIYFSLMAFTMAGCGNNQSSEENSSENIYATPPVNIAYTITNVYPHDVTSFIEGLEFHDGKFLESTGDPDYREAENPNGIGKSKLAYVDLKTGKDIQKINLTSQYFGEGCTLLNGKIYQLTYKEQKCFVYDAKSFKKINEFTFEGEGWGMTNDGKQIIMDNGSNNLYYRDPETFKITKTVGVIDNNGAVANINELEYVDGFIYASMYRSDVDRIIKIDPNTGKVLGVIDFGGVLARYAKPEEIKNRDVCNGIAYDSTTKKFYATGKYWPKMFEFTIQ